MSLKDREDINTHSVTLSVTSTIRELKLSPSTLRMVILPVGMVSIPSKVLRLWVIKPHGLGYLITLALKKRLNSSVTSPRG